MKLSLKFKVIIACSIVVLITVLAGAYSVMKVNQINKISDEISNTDMPMVSKAQTIKFLTVQKLSILSAHALTGDENIHKKYEQIVEQEKKILNEAIDEYNMQDLNSLLVKVREQNIKLDGIANPIAENESGHEGVNESAHESDTIY